MYSSITVTLIIIIIIIIIIIMSLLSLCFNFLDIKPFYEIK